MKAVELQATHPRVAFRDCSHCRKYTYDEKTGEPRTSRGELKERRKPPPCDTGEGCPKGHWSKPIELTDGHLKTLNLYWASKASGGAVLTERERSDDLLAYTFGIIEKLMIEMRQAESQATTIQAASLGAGLGGLP